MTNIQIPPAALDQSRLKEILDYDANTGFFYWKTRISNNVSDGDIAGSVSCHGYVLISIDGRKHRAHRLAWLWVYGRFPSQQIDHINRVRSDNRIKNLREVTPGENQHNYPVPKHNKSGVVGVHWYNRAQKWRARIMINGRHKELGLFDTIEEASAARGAAKFLFHPTACAE